MSASLPLTNHQTIGPSIATVTTNAVNQAETGKNIVDANGRRAATARQGRIGP
jgi:hypothetical protein